MSHSYAYRRVAIGIMNNSDKTLTLSMPVPEFPWGQWENQTFPEEIRTIPPGKMVNCVVESASYLTGCEGTLYFEVSGPVWQNWVIYWNNPYCGPNTYRQVLGGKSMLVSSNGDKEDDDLAWVVYTFTDQLTRESSTSAATPDAPEVQTGSVACEIEGEISLSTGTCMLACPGWDVIHRVEADANGQDYFRSRTCDLVRTKSTIYFPRLKAPENRVLVFFAAGQPSEHFPHHAARFAVDPQGEFQTEDRSTESRGWILVGVDGKANTDNKSNPVMVTAAEICESLMRHGYEGPNKDGRIDRLRLACHSRSSFNLIKTLESNALVTKGATGNVVEMSRLERIVSFDSDGECNLYPSLTKAGIDMNIVFGFHATAAYPKSQFNPNGGIPGATEGWTLPEDRTIQLGYRGQYPNDSRPTVRTGLVGLVRLRRVESLRDRGIEVPAEYLQLLKDADLPKLGTFNSWNIEYYCDAYKVPLGKAADPKVGAALAMGGGEHHFSFLAEFLAEAVSIRAPRIG